MKYKNFTITNYKGIKHLSLALDIQPDHKIYTLVGLNESGKTTILEAINDFEFEVPENQRHLLIPKNAAGGFTGAVTIKATLVFSEDDKKKIQKYVKEKTKAKEVIVQDTFTFERSYLFTNSQPGETKRTYTHFVKIKKTIRSHESSLDDAISGELWAYIKQNLFSEIIFYRDFLSKFPEKIWLVPTDDKERDYVSIIEDVLTSINASYNVKASLLDRLNNPTDANKQSLEAVENELGAKISKVVFDAWSKIQKVSKKEIVVKTGKDGDRHYIKLSVKEGHQTYSIAERSLGFRWFFTFLLYTEFRKERIKTSGEILFLLDEPASNLHQTAQKSLLGTFQTITTKSRLVYTTHSHHLINPIWLDATYIVKNKGLEYKEDEDFNSSKTEVEAYKYKQFVSSYPTQTSYFQPILDVLDYQPGLLELVPNIAITEGKFDYITFKYFKEIVSGDTSDTCNFYPGHGATQLDLPIGLYESWGRKYVVVLDADKEGKTQKKRYIKEISDKEHIFSLEDVDLNNDNCTTEKLFTDAEKISISKEFNPSLSVYNKSAFNTGLQILYSEKRIPDYLTQETKNKIQKIVDFVKSKMI
jgi:ABC-type molybdenum transport system ATPase subunit/photorepair protein PhrA